jgi:hypothetical protein
MRWRADDLAMQCARSEWVAEDQQE